MQTHLLKLLEDLQRDQLRSFTYACLLHDIGKVNIPDSILMKPGKLSKEEYEIIKTHPAVGAEAIIKVKGLGDSIEIIKSHHERWDGKGYPEQLKEDEIPYLSKSSIYCGCFRCDDIIPFISFSYAC